MRDPLLQHIPWFAEMQRLVGQKEIPGPQTAPFITNWLTKLNAWWRDDETPWCGVSVAGCLEAAGLAYPKAYYRARAWIGWGRVIANGKAEVYALRRHIPYGAIMVLDRPPNPRDGHVGIYAGLHEHSKGPAVSLLGGNQGNAVSFASFPLSRVLYACWPTYQTLPADVGRQLIARALGLPVSAPASTGEA